MSASSKAKRADKAPERLERVVEGEAVEQRVHVRRGLFAEGFYLFFKLRLSAECGEHSLAVFVDHLERAREKVAEVVRKVGVDALDERELGEVAIVSERDFA